MSYDSVISSEQIIQTYAESPLKEMMLLLSVDNSLRLVARSLLCREVRYLRR